MSRTADSLPPREFSADSVRARFPALAQQINGKPLAYLDNAATTQKPQSVIDAVSGYYCRDNANVHRAVHELSRRATEGYEGCRDKIAHFLGAASREEVVFTRGTTEAINLVAQSYLAPRLQAGDEILVSEMEHHSNIVPWQMLEQKLQVQLKVIPMDDRGVLDLDAFTRLLTARTRLLAIAHVSNALGTVNPVEYMIEAAHKQGVPVLVDGAQAVAHMPVNMAALDADFYTISGHKMFGPTGIGALCARRRFLDEMPPLQGGGDMISTVSFAGSTWNEVPYKFEAGTPNIAGAVGLSAALDFLASLDLQAVGEHEHRLLSQATEQMEQIPGLRIFGNDPGKAAIISFVMDGAHAHDVGTILDQMGVAVRTGHHCAMPAMEHFAVPATARASFACYNNSEDVAALINGLAKVQSLLG